MPTTMRLLTNNSKINGANPNNSNIKEDTAHHKGLPHPNNTTNSSSMYNGPTPTKCS